MANLCNIYSRYRESYLAASVTVMEVTVSTHCWTCLSPFTPRRNDARYCSVACRVRAYRLAMTPAERSKVRECDAARHRAAYAARFVSASDVKNESA